MPAERQEFPVPWRQLALVVPAVAGIIVVVGVAMLALVSSGLVPLPVPVKTGNLIRWVGYGVPLLAVPVALVVLLKRMMTARGEATHPRSGDRSYPDFFLQRCTQCKRCTEECPFGSINEDEKANPLPNPTRCRRCGTCLGACPERIISFKDYAVDIVTAMIKAVEIPDEFDEKPRVLVFLCENDAYPALEAAGRHRLQINPFMRIIPVRCLGSVNPAWVREAISAGYDGVLLIGCKHGDDYQCHFIKGSELCEIRLSKVQETLDRIQLEADRVRLFQLSINEHDKIPGLVQEFIEDLEEFGPNPFKGM